MARTPEETCDDVLAAIDPEDSHVVLIGPIRTGKSTVGRLLAARLGRSQVSMDNVRWDYYKEIGWSEEVQNEIGNREGFAGISRYWKPFEIHAIERLLADHLSRGCDCVIDFGAGHAVFEGELFHRAETALAPFQNVVLLMPDPDLDESVRIIRERDTQAEAINGKDRYRFFLMHPGPRQLATWIVYTAGKSVGQVADEVVS
jgi:hypothetical protein